MIIWFTLIILLMSITVISLYIRRWIKPVVEPFQTDQLNGFNKMLSKIKTNERNITNMTTSLNDQYSKILRTTGQNFRMINQAKMESFRNGGIILQTEPKKNFDKKGIKDHILSYIVNSNKVNKNNKKSSSDEEDDEDTSNDKDITATNIKIIRFILLPTEKATCDVNPLQLTDYDQYAHIPFLHKAGIVMNNAIVNAFGVVIDQDSDYYRKDVVPNVYNVLKRMKESEMIERIKTFATHHLKLITDKTQQTYTQLRNEKKLVSEWLSRFPCDQIYERSDLVQHIQFHIGSFVDLIADFSEG
jgi:hypothetical protein